MSEPSGRGASSGYDELPLDPDLVGPGPAADPFGRSGRRVRRRLPAGVLVAIAGGGFVGGLARYGVLLALPASGGFPWPVFLINASGAFGLALLLVLVTEVWRPTRYVRATIGTGFFGAYTTFSSVVVTADQLIAHGRVTTAAIFLATSVATGLAGASSGVMVGRSIGAHQRRRHNQHEGSE